MSVVTIAKEGEELRKIWGEITGCAIAWEIENKNFPLTLAHEYSVQHNGKTKGSWDDIPKGECELVGTEEGFLTGNHGGFIYLVPGRAYLGIVYHDPAIGASTFSWNLTADLAGLKGWVQEYSKSKWHYPTQHIQGFGTFYLHNNGIKYKIDPSFDPFKITISTEATSNDASEYKIENAEEQSGSVAIEAPDELKTLQETYGKM